MVLTDDDYIELCIMGNAGYPALFAAPSKATIKGFIWTILVAIMSHTALQFQTIDEPSDKVRTKEPQIRFFI